MISLTRASKNRCGGNWQTESRKQDHTDVRGSFRLGEGGAAEAAATKHTRRPYKLTFDSSFDSYYGILDPFIIIIMRNNDY